jgi:hypothetical protein
LVAGEHAVVKEIGGMLAYCLRALTSASPSAAALRPGGGGGVVGGGGGEGGAKGREGRQAGLVHECCAHLVVSVCSCLGI